MELHINGAERIDDESMKYWKKIGNRKYYFITAIWLDTCGEDPMPEDAVDGTDVYAVVEAVIDMKEVWLSDIEIAVSGHGMFNTIKEMERAFGLPVGELDDQIAEYIFDENCIMDSHSIGGVYSRKGAEKIIRDHLMNIKED